MTDAHDTSSDATPHTVQTPQQAADGTKAEDAVPEGTMPEGAMADGTPPDGAVSEGAPPEGTMPEGTPPDAAPPAPRRPLGPALRRQLAETLERRAQALEGKARAQLEARAAELRAGATQAPAMPSNDPQPVDGETAQDDDAAADGTAPAANVQTSAAMASAVAANSTPPAPAPPPPSAPDPGPLAQLLAAFAAADGARPAAHADHPGHRYPELPLLDQLRDLWSHLSADQQVRHSEALVPDNAGPLNSSHLVHRSLALMRELSPEYLRRFLLYADALSWMEQLDSALTAAREPAARKGAARATARGGRKPRAG
ncbi:DUF2894 domain-containing protein [Bordetella genomosp. 5]|nr:DUF2894 domain-containing protein [Bordetella genomosp. 5]